MLLTWMLVPIWTHGAGDTNELTVFTYQTRGPVYEWRVTQAKLLATPAWDISTQKVPLAPERAWDIAKRWLEAHGMGGSTLVQIAIAPVFRKGESDRYDKRLEERYHYRIAVVPAPLDRMAVVVLMDGTVVEPHPPPE